MGLGQFLLEEVEMTINKAEFTINKIEMGNEGNVLSPLSVRSSLSSSLNAGGVVADAQLIQQIFGIQNLNDFPGLNLPAKIVAYDDLHFGGNAWTYTTSSKNLGMRVNDKIESFQVHGGACVWFEHENYVNQRDGGLPGFGGGVGKYRWSSRQIFSSIIVFSLAP